MTHLARSGHTVAKPRSAVVTAALKSLTADTFISPHAAAQGVGLDQVLEAIRGHGGWLSSHGGRAAKARDRARLRFRSLLAEEASRIALARFGHDELEALIEAIADHRSDPYAAVAAVLGR